MRKIQILFIAMLILASTAKGQNLFFVDEKSYACTEPIVFQSNSDDKKDLAVFIGKNSQGVVIAVSTEAPFGGKFSQKLIIYLVDGNVIICNDGNSENVDEHAKAVYFLKNDQLDKLKNSDIHTIRYTLVFGDENDLLHGESNWSATNKGTSTKIIITQFF